MSPIGRGLVALASDTTVSTSLFLPSSSAASIIARTGLGSGLGRVSETSAGMAAGISSGDTVGPDIWAHTGEAPEAIRRVAAARRANCLIEIGTAAGREGGVRYV